jgi:hypothetical protein
LRADFYLGPGLPDLSWYNIPKRGKMYQMAIKCQTDGKVTKRTYLNHANIFHF